MYLNSKKIADHQIKIGGTRFKVLLSKLRILFSRYVVYTYMQTCTYVCSTHVHAYTYILYINKRYVLYVSVVQFDDPCSYPQCLREQAIAAKDSSKGIL